MSTQIGPGLRDYLGLSRGRAARARARRAAAGDAEQRRRDRRARRPRRTAISTVGSVLTGGVVGSVALGRQLGHRNIISTDVGGTTFLVGLVVDGEPVRATHHRHQPPPDQRADAARCTPSGPAAARSPGSTRAATCASGRAARRRRARPRLLRPGRHRADQHRRQPGARASCRSAACWAGARRSSLELAREAIRTRIAEPLGLSVEDAAAAIYAVAERPDRRPAAQDRRRGRATTRATFVLYAFGGAGPAYCAAYAAEVGVDGGRRPARAGRLGVLRLRAGGVGHRARRASCPTPRQLPFDPVRAEKNFAAARGPGARTASTAKGSRSSRSSCTARSTCATRCSSPRSPSRSPADRSTRPRSTRRPRRFETRYAELFGAGSGFREAGIQAITYRVRGARRPAVLAAAARRCPPPTAPTRPPPRRAGARSASTTARGFVDTPVYDYAALRAGHVLTGPADRRGADDHRRRPRRHAPAPSTTSAT